MRGEGQQECWLLVPRPASQPYGFDRDVLKNALALDTGALTERLLLNPVNTGLVFFILSGNASVS